jgi:glycosyltransferase involved in cell wall biosynthesis
MATGPDVAIIVPCYNAQQTLAETVASIRAQTLAQWEAICVDDESTDRTPQLLAELAAAEPRIRCLRVPHGGLAATRNRGMPLVRAQRVVFLDADDVLRPRALELFVKVARQAGPHAIVAGGYELLDRHGRPLCSYQARTAPTFYVDELLRGNRFSVTTLVPAGLLGPRPFDESLPACEDWELWLRLAQAGVRCVTIPGVVFGYRLQASSLTRKVDEFFAAGRCVLRRWLPRAREPEALRDVGHRWAAGCGALAKASGDAERIWRYFEGLPGLDPAPCFLADFATKIQWAYQFVHGADGATWRDHRETWLEEVERWLPQTPLAAHAGAILEHLTALVGNRPDGAALLRSHLAARPDVHRILLYGVGNNGLHLIERLRPEAGGRRHELVAADDFADPLAFELLGLPRDDPRAWTRWPTGTLAVITPNECDAMRATLRRAGGREGHDFVTLAHAGAAALAETT